MVSKNYEEKVVEEDFEDEIMGEKDYEGDFIEILKILSPGTAMRAALDDIMRARMGALIVVDKEGLSIIIDGGFRINSKFSSQKLVELAKMDGAIVLSSDLKKILYSNVLLIPEGGLTTNETGTRHKTAERTARQFGTMVVAVSERRNKITLYWRDKKHVLESSSEILRRATETLQILEKQKEVFDELLSHLNILEITDLVSSSDVCSILQRMEIIRRITDSVKRYLIELGREGIIVSMRLKELTRTLSANRDMVLKDYFTEHEKTDLVLKGMNFDFLLENTNVIRLLFDELHEKEVFPRGLRILKRIGFLEKDLTTLLENFGTIGKIFSVDREEIEKLFGNKSIGDSIKKELDSLKEKILEGKSI